MNDVRKNAEERASRPERKPVGASFESERQRAKNALVKQLDALDGRNIRKIAAAADAPEEEKVLRVAAYCRVSTDDIDQAISITFQIREYKKKILANPNWKYVGTYVDDGFSGTNTEHRQGFQKLMKDAMDGKIDMIITKAVSRFARNLMDCIGWVEALQNACCVSRLPGASYVELLFNPVERMLIVRPCKETHPNAIPWDAKYKSAAPLTKVIYDSMGWEADYSFRVPCQTITNPDRSNAGSAVLAFDLDNYVGRANSKKNETIIPQKNESAEDFKIGGRLMDPYERLANAIILQAVKDYRLCSRSAPAGEIELFFLSDWFEVLTRLDGQVLLSKLRKEKMAA